MMREWELQRAKDRHCGLQGHLSTSRTPLLGHFELLLESLLLLCIRILHWLQHFTNTIFLPLERNLAIWCTHASSQDMRMRLAFAIHINPTPASLLPPVILILPCSTTLGSLKSEIFELPGIFLSNLSHYIQCFVSLRHYNFYSNQAKHWISLLFIIFSCKLWPF